ncbi:MAG: hypothetical protein M3540_06010 [Actinomycetota bacterium]|nr:hypothetical protein [Actinomycetota bacterium]
MRSTCRFLGVATLIAVIGAGVALAQETDGVAVGGSNTTRAFSPALVVNVAPLPEFRRTGFDGNSGSWEGPSATSLRIPA